VALVPFSLFQGTTKMKPVDRYTTFDELPEWLTVEEIQKHLSTGRTATYEAVRSGKWRVMKAGRLVRVHKSAFAPGQEQS
jgi:excisionase family DNA binding protein